MKKFILSILAILILSACNRNALELPQKTGLNNSDRSSLYPLTKRTTVTTLSFVFPIQAKNPVFVDQSGLITTLGDNNPSNNQSSVAIFSPDGKRITLASSKIQIWDVKTFKLVHEMTCPEFDPCKFTRIKYSPDGKYIAASMEGAADGHFDYLFVWEAASGKLLKNWHQDNAFMADGSSEHRDYSIPVNDFLFLPDNKSIVYASGNTLITRNIRGNDTQDVLKLGTFYASEISGSADGRLVYTLMNWYKDHGWVGEETKQQKLQIWNIHTHAMLKEMKFPEGYDLNLKLVGPALVQIDTIKATAQITNLVKDQSEEMPFQTGDYYFNSDGKLGIIIFSDIYNQNQIIMHLWNMEKSRILYDIIPDLGEKWFINLGSIVFSPDNRTLAFCHQSQVTLWNIGPELDKSE